MCIKVVYVGHIALMVVLYRWISFTGLHINRYENENRSRYNYSRSIVSLYV